MFPSQTRHVSHKFVEIQLQLQMNLSLPVKEIVPCFNTFRKSNGPQKFCIELEADWLIIKDEARGKLPGK